MIYFTRLLRYSLDAIVVMQAVLLIFFSVLKRAPVYIGMSALLIPLTVITKLIATRLWRSQCRALDDQEAEALCGIDSRPLWEKMQRNDLGPSTAEEGTGSRQPLDALASGRYPSVVPRPRRTPLSSVSGNGCTTLSTRMVSMDRAISPLHTPRARHLPTLSVSEQRASPGLLDTSSKRPPNTPSTTVTPQELAGHQRSGRIAAPES